MKKIALFILLSSAMLNADDQRQFGVEAPLSVDGEIALLRAYNVAEGIALQRLRKKEHRGETIKTFRGQKKLAHSTEPFPCKSWSDPADRKIELILAKRHKALHQAIKSYVPVLN
jgi:hypothetical protein